MRKILAFSTLFVSLIGCAPSNDGATSQAADHFRALCTENAPGFENMDAKARARGFTPFFGGELGFYSHETDDLFLEFPEPDDGVYGCAIIAKRQSIAERQEFFRAIQSLANRLGAELDAGSDANVGSFEAQGLGFKYVNDQRDGDAFVLLVGDLK